MCQSLRAILFFFRNTQHQGNVVQLQKCNLKKIKLLFYFSSCQFLFLTMFQNVHLSRYMSCFVEVDIVINDFERFNCIRVMSSQGNAIQLQECTCSFVSPITELVLLNSELKFTVIKECTIGKDLPKLENVDLEISDLE